MLSRGWITEHTLDFEYKQYQFLSFISKAESSFRQKKLQPYLPEITMHLDDLIKLKNERHRLKTKVNYFLSGFDFENMKMHYSVKQEDEKTLESLDKILEFTEPILKSTIETGNEIKQKAEQKIHVYTLGIVPIYKDEGIIILNLQRKSRAFIFEYAINNISSVNSDFNIKTSLIHSSSTSITNNIHVLKLNFLKNYRKIPVPTTFVVESENEYPIKETILPIATQKIVDELSKSN
jgi:hypothetical protein